MLLWDSPCFVLLWTTPTTLTEERESWMLLSFSGQDSSTPSRWEPLARRLNSGNYYSCWTKNHTYFYCTWGDVVIFMLMQVQDMKTIFKVSNDIVLNLKFKTMLKHMFICFKNSNPGLSCCKWHWSIATPEHTKQTIHLQQVHADKQKSIQHTAQAGFTVSFWFLGFFVCIGGGGEIRVLLCVCATPNPTHMWGFLKEHNEYV